MATTFKTLTANDVTNTRTLLHEAIPLTGTIVSGTYADQNVKTFTHGMFESTFDYPYLSSSANHILDISVGYSSTSPASASTSVQNSKKINIYNQMASVLVGHDVTGGIQQFDRDGNISGGGTKTEDGVFFINFSRLLVKDEIKKGSFSLTLLTGGVPTPVQPNANLDALVLADHGAATSYFVNSPAGEYAPLFSSSTSDAQHAYGLLFYQAGIAVVTGSAFMAGFQREGDTAVSTGSMMGGGAPSSSFQNLLTGSTIESMAGAIRNRVANISFNNTVELNSTIYFCRANNNEFNYSSNPTYLNSSEIRVKNTTSDNPVAYITTVGLYSSDNELLAVAKLSEPLKKDPNTELTIRVRLDY